LRHRTSTHASHFEAFFTKTAFKRSRVYVVYSRDGAYDKKTTCVSHTFSREYPLAFWLAWTVNTPTCMTATFDTLHSPLAGQTRYSAVTM